MKEKQKNKRNVPEPQLPRNASLRFTPYAWAKVQFFCHRDDTEIGGFGITDGDPLLVEDFVAVKQDVTPVSV